MNEIKDKGKFSRNVSLVCSKKECDNNSIKFFPNRAWIYLISLTANTTAQLHCGGLKEYIGMGLNIFWQAWQAPLAIGQVNQPENICSNIKEGLFVGNMKDEQFIKCMKNITRSDVMWCRM